LVSKGTRRRRGNKLKSFVGVTIHNVGNNSRGANADANARYQKNSANDAANGWHFTVDEKEIVRSIPEDEIAEHSGKRLGNDTTVGIEICDNVDGNALEATNNGAWLAAKLLKDRGISKAVWKQNIFQHNDWTGKDCPAQIRRGNPYNWATFVNKVNEYMGAGGAETTPVPSQPPAPVPALPRNLKYKSPMMRGDDVLQAQQRLERHHASPGKIDGVFGRNTEAAVKRFQQARIDEGRDVGCRYNGNKPDGKVGINTWAILWE
jgi:N-acetylmuramoyl-L-alanine amidase CwlA